MVDASFQFPETVQELPESIELRRNGHPLTAQRVRMGTLALDSGRIRIGDSDVVSAFKPLAFAKGSATVDVYRWSHEQRGDINVLAVVRAEKPVFGSFQPVNIENDYREDLDAIPVDSGAIGIEANGQTIIIPSAFGDGLYPVFGVKPWFKPYQILVVDFQIWKILKVISTGETARDEKYNVIYRIGKKGDY